MSYSVVWCREEDVSLNDTRKTSWRIKGQARRDGRKRSSREDAICEVADRGRVEPPANPRERERCPAMKLEFNGRVVLGFVVGLVCGAAATLVITEGQVGRIQIERDVLRVERDYARATSERQDAEIQRLTAQRTGQTAAPTAAAPQDPAVQVLNAIRPGLGTAAGALASAAQKSQLSKASKSADQQQCPAGSSPQTDPNWQGVRCVATDPPGTN